MEKITEVIAEAEFLFEIEGVEFHILEDKSYWITNMDGEGTQVSREKMEFEINNLFDQLM